ncbi:DUF3572 domain-containing protein [Pseudochrobactrum algeriensis]|uniref:DUF3572 domain-containing protein n=1 Tax=Pseudochrobactrum algeriensis TaxID=2834768 RepID=UPI001BCA6E91|nr:DUF3572 domain-containing protein [Pseudochrobactrum algeriensis]MBX8811378.1 DUF3572 domain-containing protein [Ochrobactrum sp. MR34]QVQ38032.1 DUF3572 domain-containing protein [Pseudochrobactrum algeriensis]QVQ41254.1 DUF3572 domain-containing protein [Pseudochrobactrum algeriensis]QVQ45178.1 DUF3572 domain-containing protein [Pseudochrobactrum algeriensis]
MSKTILNQSDAENLAIEALVFLAQQPDLMNRFLSLTGIEVSSIREAADEPAFLTGVLQFYLAHEPTLMQFCEATGHKPESMNQALHFLPNGDSAYDQSM